MSNVSKASLFVAFALATTTSFAQIKFSDFFQRKSNDFKWGSAANLAQTNGVQTIYYSDSAYKKVIRGGWVIEDTRPEAMKNAERDSIMKVLQQRYGNKPGFGFMLGSLQKREYPETPLKKQPKIPTQNVPSTPSVQDSSRASTAKLYVPFLKDWKPGQKIVKRDTTTHYPRNHLQR